MGLGTKIGLLEVGAGVGVETVEHSWWRVQGNALLGSSTEYISASLETGGGGGWYLFEASSRVPALAVGVEHVGLGIRFQRFVGIGPRIEYDLGSKFLVWAVPVAWDVENNNARNAIITLRYSP